MDLLASMRGTVRNSVLRMLHAGLSQDAARRMREQGLQLVPHQDSPVGEAGQIRFLASAGASRWATGEGKRRRRFSYRPRSMSGSEDEDASAKGMDLDVFTGCSFLSVSAAEPALAIAIELDQQVHPGIGTDMARYDDPPHHDPQQDTASHEIPSQSQRLGCVSPSRSDAASFSGSLSSLPSEDGMHRFRHSRD